MTPAKAAAAPPCEQCRYLRSRGNQVTQRVQAKHRITTPGPTAFHRINESGHHDRESQKGEKLHSLGDRARYDGHRGGNKDHLKKEVR